MKKIICFSLFALFLISCAKKKEKSQAEEDEKIIVKYLEDNGINATATGSGLYYWVQEQGTGDQAYTTATVKVYYKGYLTDNTVFDESAETGATFSLTQVIQGWQEGIPKFKEGGKGKLFIPSKLGYGNKAVGSIPKNAVLIFDIELFEVL